MGPVSQVWSLIRMQDRTNVGVVGACLVDRLSVKSAHRSKTVARGPVNGILYPLSANTLKRVRHSKWSRPHTQTTSGCVEAKHPDVGCGAPSKMADATAKGCNICIGPAVEEVRLANRETPTDDGKCTENTHQGWFVRLSSARSCMCRYFDLGIYSFTLDDGNVGGLRARASGL